MSGQSDCRKREENIALLVLGGLDTSTADELRHHLATCETCRQLHADLERQEGELSSAFHLIEQRLERRESVLVKLTPDTRRYRILHSRTLRWLVPTAAAAAVLLVVGLWPKQRADGLAWADVVKEFDSRPFYHVVLYAKQDVASEPTQMELWVSGGNRARARIGSQVQFIEDGEIVAGYDYREKKRLRDSEYDRRMGGIIGVVHEHKAISLDNIVRAAGGGRLVETTPRINSDAMVSRDLLVFDLDSTTGFEWMRIWVLRESTLPIRIRMWDPRDGGSVDVLVTYEQRQPEEFFNHRKYEELLLDTSRAAGSSMATLAYALLKDPGGEDYAPQNAAHAHDDSHPIKGHLSEKQLAEYYKANPLEPGQVEFRAGLRKDGVTIGSIQGLQDYKYMQVGTSASHFATLYYSPSYGRFRIDRNLDGVFVQYDIISRGDVSTQKLVELALAKVGVEIVESEDDCTIWTAEYNGQEPREAHSIKCPVPKGQGPGTQSAAYPMKIGSLLRHLANEQDIVVEDETGIDKDIHLSNVAPNLRGKEGVAVAVAWYRDNFGITFRKSIRRMPVWIVRKKG